MRDDNAVTTLPQKAVLRREGPVHVHRVHPLQLGPGQDQTASERAGQEGQGHIQADQVKAID